MKTFASRTISSVRALIDYLSRHQGEWAYRGHSDEWPLAGSLERLLGDWKASLAHAPRVERQMILEFRRRYRFDNQVLVRSDVLYCLSVMQHYGLPTRLLECSYSPFVAAKFAIDYGGGRGTIWCVNTRWCRESAARIVGKQRVQARVARATRDDLSFEEIYMGSKARKFVLPERPADLHERLIVQQGTYLCPGNVGAGFIRNITAMPGWEKDTNVVRLRLRLSNAELRMLQRRLVRMNVTSAELFPGLDGIVRSVRERLQKDQDRRHAARPRRRRKVRSSRRRSK
jgi:FRG domain